MSLTNDEWEEDQWEREVDGSPLFDTNKICVICGHMAGDHERYPGTNVWTCDDDCNLETCRVHD